MESGGGRIRTDDLEVMSLASYLAAPPRDNENRNSSGVFVSWEVLVFSRSSPTVSGSVLIGRN